MLAAYATNIIYTTEEIPDQYTNPDTGIHLEWMITDSKGGTKPTAGRNIASGLAYQYQRSPAAIIPYTTGDLQYVVTNGSPWPEYMYNLNALTGEKCCTILSTRSGSQLYSDTAALSWRNDGTGVLWPQHSAYAISAMSLNAVTKIKRVHIILSINDMNDGTRTNDSINSDWIDLIDRVIALCDPLEIWVNITGQEAQQSLKRQTNLFFIKSLPSLPAYLGRVFLAVNEYMIFKSGGSAEGLHWNDEGNDKVGYLKAQQIAAKKNGLTDVDLLSVVYANQWDDLSTNNKTLYTNYTNGLRSASLFTKLSALQIRRADTRKNALTDYTRNSCGEDFGFTFFAKDRVLYDGVSNRINTWFNPAAQIGLGIHTQTDFVYFVKTAESLTAAGVLASVFGQTVTARTMMQQTAGSAFLATGNANAGATWTGSTIIPGTSWIYIIRNGTSLSIMVNGTVVFTTTIATTGVTNGSFFEGCRGSGLTTSEYWNGAVICSGYAAYTGFDIPTFTSLTDTLLTGLAA